MFKLLNFIVNVLHCITGLWLILIIAVTGAVLGVFLASILWVVGINKFGLSSGALQLVLFVSTVAPCAIGPVALFCSTEEVRQDCAFVCASTRNVVAFLKQSSSLAVLGGVTGLLLVFLGVGYGWFR